MKKFFRNMDAKKRILSLMLAFVFILSTFMSGTLTWFAAAGAVNEFSGQKGDYAVTLLKLERDLDGNVTETPIKNAEFYLYRIVNADPEEVEQVGERYQSDDKGFIQVSKLVSGEYYFLETNPSYGYDYDKEGEAEKTRYPFAVSQETADATGMVSVKAYNQKVSAPLSITKNVVNKDGTALSEEQKNMNFEFTVVFSDGKSYPYSIDGGKEQDLLEGGKLSLKHGQTAVFAKLPVGIHYSVTESPVEGYVVTSENSSGNVGLENLEKPEANKVTFTNTYSTKDTSSLTVTKNVTGIGDTEKIFTFTVNLGTDPEAEYAYQIIETDGTTFSEGILKSGEQIRLKHGQKTVFTELPVGLPYTVTEQAEEGYTSLTGVQQGQIIADGSTAAFVNDMTKPQEYGNLLIKKTVTGNEGDLTKDFVFKVFIDGIPKEFMLKSGETKLFENIPVGTKYQVVETDYSSEGYITSSVNSDNTIQLGENVAEFTNTKEVIEPEKLGSLKVTKTVINGNPDDVFKFHVQIGNETHEITLKDGETKEFMDIPVGTHYSVLEENYYHQGYITTSTGATGTIIEDGATAAYTNTKEEGPAQETGALHISKVVSGAGDTEKAFTFAVSFSDGKDYKFKIDDGKKEYNLKDGKLELKHGETAIFEKLPSGITYTVVEESAQGYIQGVMEQTGIIAANGTVYAKYNNYKEPSAEDGKLVVRKVTTGEGADLEKKFDFTVTINEEKTEFALANGEEKKFSLPPGATYSVIEKNYINEGYTQSSIVNGNGTSLGGVVEVICTNTYMGEVLTDISGEKIWDAPESVELPKDITIYLKNGDQIVSTKTVSAKDNWKYTFNNIPKFDSAGKEIQYTVDEAPVEFFEKEINGFNIKNVYVKPVTQAVPTVEKKIRINGDGEAKESTFSFTMKALNNAPMPEDAKEGIKNISINGEGSVDFGKIIYKNAGTYSYLINETIGSADGYTYDTTTYRYTVVVEKDGAKLTASSTLTKEGDEGYAGETAVFTNMYTPQDKDRTSLTVNKVWAGTKNPNQPTSIEVQLYRDGVAKGDVIKLDKTNNWVHTWTGLDKSATWTVDEVKVPDNYVKVITENGKQGYTITNTYTPNGSGDNSGGGNNGQTPGGGNNQGGSGSSVNGPKTNDPNSMWLWFTLMILSAIALRMVVFRKNPYSGK